MRSTGVGDGAPGFIHARYVCFTIEISNCSPPPLSRNQDLGLVWGLMPIIQEAEAGGLQSELYCKTLSQNDEVKGLNVLCLFEGYFCLPSFPPSLPSLPPFLPSGPRVGALPLSLTSSL